MRLSGPNIWLLAMCTIAVIAILLLYNANSGNNHLFNTSASTLSKGDSGLALLQKSKDELFLAENAYRNFLSSKNIADRQVFITHISNFTNGLSGVSGLTSGSFADLHQQLADKLELSELIAWLKLAADTLLQQVSNQSPAEEFALNVDTIRSSTLEKYIASLVDTVKFVPVKQRKGFFRKVGDLFRNNKGDSVIVEHNKGSITEQAVRDSSAELAHIHAQKFSGMIRNYYQRIINKELALRKKIDAKELLIAQKNIELFSSIESQVAELTAQIADTRSLEKQAAVASLLKTQQRKNAILWISLSVIAVTIVLLGYSIYRAWLYEKRILNEKQRAEDLVQLKSRFLSRMSHEIRSPLTTIIGFTEYMQNSRNEKDADKYLDAIRIASDHLLSTVNDILDYSKLEAGKIKLNDEPFQLKRLLDDTIAVYTLHARDKKLLLKLQCNFEEQLVLSGDAFRLKQVLYNLISNAIKFTHTGAVEVTASIKQSGTTKVLADFKVFDTGIGIPSEQFDFIFEEFAQVKNNSNKINRSIAGTGLGLSICRMLVELQGGMIKVDSELNKGSVFSFSVPYTISCKEAINAENKSQALEDTIPAFEGRRILVVEDSDFNIMLLSLFLTRYALQYDVAKDGEVALQLFNKNRYDMVLTDIHVPKITGYELAVQIRRNETKKKAEVPIIALTANPVEEDFNLYYEHGINDVITKPFKEIDLRSKLVAYFQVKEMSEIR